MSSNKERNVYLVGGGIASLAAAAFLIRDGGVRGENIFILEESKVLGGSLDGAGDPDTGYVIRGGRMFTSRGLYLHVRPSVFHSFAGRFGYFGRR